MSRTRLIWLASICFITPILVVHFALDWYAGAQATWSVWFLAILMCLSMFTDSLRDIIKEIQK